MLLNDQPLRAYSPNSHQMIMGAGKTTVVAPLLAMILVRLVSLYILS